MANTDPPQIWDQLWSGWSGRIALDVGARRGESIPDLIRCGFTDITCFEPVESSYQVLRNVAQGFNADRYSITTVNCAVSEHNGSVTLFVTDAMQKGELVSRIDGMEWSPTDWDSVPCRAVPCTTLDTWCQHHMPDFVKVDTEGHEDKILLGACTLLNHGCGWLIEFHSPENHSTCVSLLSAYGYETSTIRHPHYTPESPMWRQHGWVRAEKRGQL